MAAAARATRPALAAASRENPIPVGQTAEAAIIDHKWDLTVLKADLNAPANSVSTPTSAGQRTVIVRVRTVETFSKGDSPHPVWLDYHLIGSSNAEITSNSCIGLADKYDGYKSPGKTVEGNICYAVPANETGLVLFRDFGDPMTYFALQ